MREDGGGRQGRKQRTMIAAGRTNPFFLAGRHTPPRRQSMVRPAAMNGAAARAAGRAARAPARPSSGLERLVDFALHLAHHQLPAHTHE